jgi:hypothetical protein
LGVSRAINPRRMKLIIPGAAISLRRWLLRGRAHQSPECIFHGGVVRLQDASFAMQ